MIGVLDAHNIIMLDNSVSYSELVFSISKYVNNELSPLWDSLVDFKLVYCPEMNTWFEATVEINEDNETEKNVMCKSLGEAELSQIMLYDIEINTETDISRDDYKATALFDETDAKASLLNRIMEKAPHYTIRHVDASIAKIQRTFKFDGTSIYDAFQSIATEIDCIFIIDSGNNEHGNIARAISVYDLESSCKNCGKRGNFLQSCPDCGSHDIYTGYGKDTNVFVCANNLAEGIRYITDTDSVKNCFRLVGGDDLMTATIANCNPNGSSYLWYLSDAVRSDMSDELKARLRNYDALYDSYQNTKSIALDPIIVNRYNTLVDKYLVYKAELAKIPNTIIGYPALMNAYYDTIDMQLLLHDELMPSVETSNTTATKQAMLLNSTSLSTVAVPNLKTCSAASASNAVLAMAKIIVDRRYRVKVNNGVLSGTLWSGSFSITNYSKEDDAAETGTIYVTITDNYSEFVQQKLNKVLSDSVDGSSSKITELFSKTLGNFKHAIKGYCLVSLQSFADACQSCLDIMIEQGIANNETWANQSPNLYTTLYMPYYEKHKALQEEMVLRETEIATVAGRYDTDGKLQEDGLQTIIQRKNNEIHEALHFENYLGDSLWKEFVSYRREDTYKNDNYISDGLSNKELFSLALEFIEKAKQEIYKSATLQHSITATLKNLLVMKEFEPIVDSFEVGNWIRVSVDDTIYRLRLVSYEVDYNDLSTISVVFSDITKVITGFTDSESLLSQMTSLASSYGSVTRQAEQASQGKVTLDSWITEGLALTKMKIIDSARDQNVTFDEHGVLCRQFLPITESYDDKQLKIINRGLYLTDDGWLTSRAGIGDFVFYNPETGNMEESYGVIADTLVGNLILSKKVGIYNMDNSIVLDENGIVMTTNGANVPGDQKVFTIRRKDYDENGVELLTNLFFVDNDGNLTFTGTLKGANGDFTGNVTATSLTIEGTPANDYVNNRAEAIAKPIRDSLTDLIDTVDGETVIYYSTTAPSNPKDKDIWYNTSNHQILRYDSDAKRWEDITNTSLGLSLKKISDAQATADGKIITFAQANPPTAAAIGDLWIDTDDKNKLYRWDGTKWVEYRDKTIADAQATANSAYSYAEDVWNGKKGIFFNSSNVSELALNTTVGLKITGKDGTYFQVKNNAMGFFKSNGSAMLYYENGNMTLNGIIAATGGYIGGAGGWIIGTNCLYNGGASYLGAAGGIYLGNTGVSVGSAIVMKPDGSFVIKGDNTTNDDTNFVLKIVPYLNDQGDTIYQLCLGNITFDDSFVLPPSNGGTGGTGRDDVGKSIGIYRVRSKSEMQNLQNSVNGDLCILNSEGAEGVSISGWYTTSTTTSPGHLPIGTYGADGHRYTNYFDISGIAYWNIANLSGESVSSSYARVGVGHTVSGAAGLYVPIRISATGAVTSITIEFKFATRPVNCTRDLCAEWRNGIHISLYRGNSSSKVATTTYTMPDAWKVRSSTLRTATVTLNSSTGITAGEYYLAFYTNNTYSLMWIQPDSVRVEGRSIGTLDGLYLRSGNMWKSIASSENYGITYVLPAASTSALGGVKIGNNISLGADGTISLSQSNIISALGYTPASSNGSAVSISNRLTEGTRIATITINNTGYDLYAPTSSGGSTVVYPIAVNSGGTGATTAKQAVINLGIFYSSTLPSTGTDGQICLVPV